MGLADAQCLGAMEAVVVGYMYGWSSNPFQPNGIGGLCVPGEKYCVFLCLCVCTCVCAYMCMCMSKCVFVCVPMFVVQVLICPLKSLRPGSATLDP